MRWVQKLLDSEEYESDTKLKAHECPGGMPGAIGPRLRLRGGYRQSPCAERELAQNNDPAKSVTRVRDRARDDHQGLEADKHHGNQQSRQSGVDPRGDAQPRSNQAGPHEQHKEEVPGNPGRHQSHDWPGLDKMLGTENSQRNREKQRPERDELVQERRIAQVPPSCKQAGSQDYSPDQMQQPGMGLSSSQ